MVNINDLNKIENELDKWEKDLNPKYVSNVTEFFGRLVRKIQSGFLKVGYFFFITHKWETKQERYLNNLNNQLVKIDEIYKQADQATKALLEKQINKMNEICTILLSKEDKVPTDKVNSLMLQLQQYGENNAQPKQDIEIVQEEGHDEQKFKDFLEAIENNDLETVKKLVNKKFANSPSEKYHMLPLHRTILLEHTEIVKCLLPYTTDINSTYDEEKLTPLHCAAISGNIEIVKFLISKGADQNAHTNEGKLPFHIAASGKNLEVVKLLIPKNLDEKFANTSCGENNELPLHLAAQGGHLEIVLLLLPFTKDINCTNIQKWTPLHYAASSGHIDIVNHLVTNGANPDVANNNSELPLHLAVRHRHLEIVKFLTPKMKKDIDATDNQGRTALFYAAGSRNTEILDYLLQQKANPNTHDKNGLLPLHYAARSGSLENMEKLLGLLKKPDTINAKDNQGRTVLSWSIESRDKNSVDFLLQKKADKNIADKDNKLPFHYAAHFCSDVDIIKLLKPEKINVQDAQGRTALTYAAEGERTKNIEWLLENGADPNSPDKQGRFPIHYAAKVGYTFIDLLVRPENINIQDKDGRTALSFAAEKEVVTIRHLIKAGADINIPDKNGNLPFHHAAIEGAVNCTYEFRNHHYANIDVPGMNGRTALSFAAEAKNEGKEQKYEEIVEFLLKGGAKTNLTDPNGNTPLHYAAKGGKLRTLGKLMQKLIQRNRLEDISLKNEEGKTAYALAMEANVPQQEYIDKWPDYME